MLAIQCCSTCRVKLSLLGLRQVPLESVWHHVCRLCNQTNPPLHFSQAFELHFSLTLTARHEAWRRFPKSVAAHRAQNADASVSILFLLLHDL